MWFGIIWFTMWAGHRWNTNLYFMLAKIFVSAALVVLFFDLGWPLEAIFGLCNRLFRTEWIAREWTFRVTLDIFIPYGGMLAALAYIKILEMRLPDRPWWPSVTYYAIAGSGVAMVGYFAFELTHQKFVCMSSFRWILILC